MYSGSAPHHPHLVVISFSGCMLLRHLEQSFAAPDSNNTHSVFFETIYDTKRWVDNLLQVSDTKLRHNTAAFREAGKLFHLGNHLSQQPLTHVRNLLVSIPSSYFLKVPYRRGSKGD